MVSAATGAKAAGVAARSPLVRHYGGDRPQEFRAHLRAVTNVGVSLGALLAGWAVQVGTLAAYRLMVLGTAVACTAAAALLAFLPPVTPVPAGGGPRRLALRDRPYLLLPRRADGRPVEPCGGVPQFADRASPARW
ncbi:hypothetical protein [Streptomyces sp. NPDC001480]|uniref:hypothetical protein n=1 Tax=Streptomyces sp. NPDC001480 TaxID=3364577 RepID=UPI0036C4FAB4